MQRQRQVGLGATRVEDEPRRRAQLDSDGYFAGYMVKTQPVGSYELGKCLRGMDVLRDRIRVALTPGDQTRVVVRRMALDLELRGILRGAPEIFNLSVNMRKEDSMFQECIRISWKLVLRAWTS